MKMLKPSHHFIPTKLSALVFILCSFVLNPCFGWFITPENQCGQIPNDSTPLELDRYGGYPKIKFEATGFFRTDKTNQRHWLVTPEGNAFISFGINHLDSKWMKQFYNIDYWGRWFRVSDYSGRSFHNAFMTRARLELLKMRWNTLGCHTPSDIYDNNPIPYVKTIRFVNIQHYKAGHSTKDFPDVFSAAFERYADSLAERIALPRKNDPYLLGYFMTDGPILTEQDAARHGNNIFGKTRGASPTWPNVMRNLGAGHPGKSAYVQSMKNIYRKDITQFNATYSTNFNSWQDLLKSADWRLKTDLDNSKEQRDNHIFLLEILDKRYQVECEAIKKYDPNHLILGDKFNGNTNTPNDIIEVASKYFDVIFIQHYALWNELEVFLNRITSVTDLPIIQGDASVNVPNENMPNPYGPHVANQQIRVQLTKELMEGSFKRPEFIGWHWCGWMDSWQTEGPVSKQHAGIQDPFGNYHQVADYLAEFSDQLFHYIIGNGTP